MNRQFSVICPLFSFDVPVALFGNHKMSSEEVKSYFINLNKQLAEGIELGNGIMIRRTNESHKTVIEQYAQVCSWGQKIHISKFVLENPIIMEEQIGSGEIDQAISNIILALRLLNKGYISANFVLYTCLTGDSWAATSFNDDGVKTDNYSLPYSIRFEEIAKLKELIGLLQQINFSKRRRLELACKRFQRAYEENNAEDQLIDLMIAFEALFIRDNISGASSREKIANGCSTLIGSEKGKLSIKENLLYAGKLRNRIVHGADYKELTEEKPLKPIIEEIDDYMRRSLRIIIQNQLNEF